MTIEHNAHSHRQKGHRFPLHGQWSCRPQRILYPYFGPRPLFSYRYVSMHAIKFNTRTFLYMEIEQPHSKNCYRLPELIHYV